MPANLAGMTRLACLALFTLIVTGAAAQQPPVPGPAPDEHAVPEPGPGPDPHALPDGPGEPHEGLVKPPDELPKLRGSDRYRNLDFLFGALKVAPDDSSAKAVEDRIWAVWTAAGSETTILLMDRAKRAIDDAAKATKDDDKVKSYDLALQLLDAIIEIKPDYTEAWNRRATVYFMKKDYTDSMADLLKVLEREPRHFGALSGLGLIMQDIGDDKHALDAYRKALEVYPRLKGMQDKVKALKEKVEGRNI